MGLHIQGFKNHMLHKKDIWKPEAMTLSNYMCVFIFDSQAKVDLVKGEMGAFNSYYGYDIKEDKDSHSVCLINDAYTLKKLKEEKQKT